MQLPDSLQPWRQWLEWFAPEHLPLFADLLGRLNPLLGPLRGRQQGGVPEPDGIGDLQRRGPYERLVSSEWLLAEEMPDEFLRRAAAGEHMFVAPQYRARQANRLIVVLLDAGPLQLGAARLVHLALLMLLARRAEEAGAEFRWGILQGTPQLNELQSSAQLKHLLNARTYQVVTDYHWHAWQNWLLEQQHTAGECWIVGQRLPATDSRYCTHRVQIHRSLDGRSLSFELQAATSRKVSLPIPEERSAARLLQGYFDNEVAPVSVKGVVPRASLTLPPVISSGGGHVAIKLLDEPGMAVIKLPTGNQKKNLEVRKSLWSAGRTPLTMAFLNRTVGAVLSDDQQLWFWNMQAFPPVARPRREELQLPPGTATLLPVAWLRSGAAGRVLLLDTQGRLGFWIARTNSYSVEPDAGKLFHLAEGVLGLAKVDKAVAAYVSNDAGRLSAQSVTAEGKRSPAFALGVAEGVSKVLFAASPIWSTSFGGCALGSIDNGCESWRLISASSFPVQAERINLAHGWRGLGLLAQKRDDHLSLVVLGPDQQTVALYGERQQRVLFTTSDAIAKVSFCPLSGLVAVLTQTKELLVYSVVYKAMRLQVLCNQPAEKKGGVADA